MPKTKNKNKNQWAN